MQLVPREDVAALSYLATDPDLSPHWQAAEGLPTTRGRVEELIALRPTLVLAGKYSTPGANAALREAGIPVVEVGFPESFAELREEIRSAARALGAEARAEVLLAEMDARLARLRKQAARAGGRPSAMFVFHDGSTPGAFAAELLELAGLRDASADLARGGSPLERVLLARPGLLLRVGYREGAPTFTELPLSRAGARVMTVPFRYLACPDPASLDLVETLVSEAAR